jgi:ubiquinone/menaquinone biosynthesis C-methylase UbiE
MNLDGKQDELAGGEAYFEGVAREWDELRASFFSEAVRDRALTAAKVERNRIAADIGSGTGFMTEGLVRLGVRVIAIDQSEAMLEVLRNKFPSNGALEPRRGYADDVPIADDAVDYAFANMYLHHVEGPPHAIREMARILKPGGKLVITDLDEHQFEFLRSEHHDRWMGFRRQDVQDWLRGAGLKGVAVESTGETCTSGSQGEASGANIGIFIASGEK